MEADVARLERRVQELEAENAELKRESRHLRTETGRFLQRDPLIRDILPLGRWDSDIGIDVYVYVSGSPLSFVDPSGLIVLPPGPPPIRPPGFSPNCNGCFIKVGIGDFTDQIKSRGLREDPFGSTDRLYHDELLSTIARAVRDARMRATLYCNNSCRPFVVAGTCDTLLVECREVTKKINVRLPWKPGMKGPWGPLEEQEWRHVVCIAAGFFRCTCENDALDSDTPPTSLPDFLKDVAKAAWSDYKREKPAEILSGQNFTDAITDYSNPMGGPPAATRARPYR